MTKNEVYKYLNSQDVEDYWDNEMYAYQATSAAEEILYNNNIEEGSFEEEEVFEMVMDWFVEKSLI